MAQSQSAQSTTWRFPANFWIANSVELLERAAFYCMFIAISLYLTNVVGFDDKWAGIIGAFFSAGVYFLPPFTGAFSDKIGFRASLLIAFSLLSVGYFALSITPFKAAVIPALALLMFGGSFIKSIITGTVAQNSSESNRARAYSIFYFVVNIGAFTGKMITKPVRLELGLEAIGYFSGVMSLIALIVVFFLFKNMHGDGHGKSLMEVWQSFVRVVKNTRLLVLIMIVAGFWLVQHQMYASMPKYVIRMVGEKASVEWYSNVNSACVILFVMFVTNAMRRFKALTSISIGMLLMPISAVLMAVSPWLEAATGQSISMFGLFTLHPVALTMVIGIGIQGIAECFISPRYLEFFSLQAPKGEEGLYLGFSHLHSFFANFVGFFISGFLLDAYCPNPNKAEFAGMTTAQLAPYYQHAHYIWYYFAGIGLIAALALYIYNYVVERLDRK
ncbi:MAG: Dipeptide/tripeptide permease [Ignavibacteria bacterium]|nr:Dipeptide/tripeptide permease [Ignavibacteria bacterium]